MFLPECSEFDTQMWIGPTSHLYKVGPGRTLGEKGALVYMYYKHGSYTITCRVLGSST